MYLRTDPVYWFMYGMLVGHMYGYVGRIELCEDVALGPIYIYINIYACLYGAGEQSRPISLHLHGHQLESVVSVAVSRLGYNGGESVAYFFQPSLFVPPRILVMSPQLPCPSHLSLPIWNIRLLFRVP